MLLGVDASGIAKDEFGLSIFLVAVAGPKSGDASIRNPICCGAERDEHVHQVASVHYYCIITFLRLGNRQKSPHGNHQ